MKKLLFLAVTAFVLSMATLPASAQYQPMFITVSPTAVTSCGSDTGSVTINAGYFQAGSNVVITVQSDPVTLGTVVASATGTVTATYSLPVGLTAGQHTVIATGPRLDTGLTESVNAAITVTIPSGCVSSNNVTQTSTTTVTTSAGTLPRTGSDNRVVVAAGAALLVAGGLLVLATRRRSSAA